MTSHKKRPLGEERRFRNGPCNLTYNLWCFVLSYLRYDEKTIQSLWQRSRVHVGNSRWTTSQARRLLIINAFEVVDLSHQMLLPRLVRRLSVCLDTFAQASPPNKGY